MKTLTPQELNYEAFRCELRVLPDATEKDYKEKLEKISTLSSDEQREVALALLQDKTQDKKQRFERAMQIWAHLGDSTSLFYLATAYFLLKDEENGFKYLKISAKEGNLQAQLHLGYCTLMGVGTKPELKKACLIFKKLSQEKIPEAVYFVGALYMLDEDFVQKDPVKARKMLLWSVEHGCKFALFEHGITLIKKPETKKRGLDLIYQAAKKQEVRAMMWLAIESARGTIIPQNYADSKMYLEKCCYLGFRPAIAAVKEAQNNSNEG